MILMHGWKSPTYAVFVACTLMIANVNANAKTAMSGLVIVLVTTL